MRWWRNRQDPDQKPPKVFGNKPVVKQANLPVNLGITGGVVGTALADVKANRAQAEYVRTRDAAPKPNLLDRWQAPRGTRVLHGPSQGERYIGRHHLDRQSQLAQTIKRYLGPNSGGGAFVERQGKHPSLIMIPRSESRQVLRHEIGHAKAFGDAQQHNRTYGLPRWLSRVAAPVVGSRRTPQYRLEADAWNRSGVAANDPVRQASLGTYEANLDRSQYGVRGTAAGAGAGLLANRLRTLLKSAEVKTAGPTRWLMNQMLRSLRRPTSELTNYVLPRPVTNLINSGNRMAANSLRHNPEVLPIALAGSAIPLPGSGIAVGAGYLKAKQLLGRLYGTPKTELGRGALRLNAPLIKRSEALPKVGLDFYDAGQLKASCVVEVADTQAARARGLMGRSQVPDGSGMFFDKVGSYWMKNVLIPLDIVFVDQAGMVLEKQAMPVDTFGWLERRTYQPTNQKAAHAIELPSGWFDRQGLRAGCRVVAKA
jgi:uncharacterized membrane protein (UPF0127 family)